MNTIFKTLFAAARAKILPLWNKLRLLLSPTFWRTRGMAALRSFFAKLFDIRPRDKKDYYTIFRWMISRRLAFAIVIAVGLLGVWYIFVMSPLAPSGETGADASIPIYKYNSLPLKFHEGTVKIQARDKHIAYVGDVKDGYASGQGRVYDPEDALIYDGALEKNMYEGMGRLYYPDGTLQYEGTFSQNIFHGSGAFFRPSGVLEYNGDYVNGYRSGRGELFNVGGNKIFEGGFLLNELIYSEFIGKTTVETASMYLGQSSIYSASDETCVTMEEIGAIRTVTGGAGSLEEEWIVERVYVLRDTIPLGGKLITSVSDLTAAFGAADYQGFTWVNLSDAVAVNQLRSDEIIPVEITAQAAFDNVFTVSGYDDDRQIYIHVFKANGLVYTFYCAGSNAERFLMFSIEG